jgi:hypothetical protein
LDVSAETLLMYGEKNRLAWIDRMLARLQTQLPRVRTVGFPGLDHFGINRTDPEQVAMAVRAFFLSSS